MTDEGPLAIEQVTAMLDNAPMAVYVTEPCSWKLIYANSMAKDLFLCKAGGQGLTCYQAAGFDRPCSFCRIGEMSRSGFLRREFYHPLNHHTYELEGRIIDWAGRPAHIEYILDITERKKEEGYSRQLEGELTRANDKMQHTICKLRETQLELAHLVNSIPGGIASYQVIGERFIPIFFSDGAMALSGHSREEYRQMCCNGIFALVHELDRDRVRAAAMAAFANGNVLDTSYRMRHKDGSLIWIHINGRRIGTSAEDARFYAVFTGMSAEARLFQSIANETADAIYVIDKENYDLLYANESKSLFLNGSRRLGQKCYAALHGREEPCQCCTLKSHNPDGIEHEMTVEGTKQFYYTRFRETDWNGIPAYVKYVRDVTEEINTRREKERLEMYFKTLVEKLPGGISVIRCSADGELTPEFVSDGLASMVRMTVDEVKSLWGQDVLAGIFQDDAAAVRGNLMQYVDKGQGRFEFTGRMKQGGGGYIWTRCALSVLETSDGIRRLYAVYTDISATVEEKEKIRRQYEELILQHYRMPGPDALIVGHCNITRNKILEIIDYTGSDLLENFGDVRETFFTKLSGLVVDETERREFLGAYLNEPALAAFYRNDTEQIVKCFVRLPGEEKGRYVEFKVNLVETPDTGDITGILTVTDITEQTISERILKQLSVVGYDFVIDLDLDQDAYGVLACSSNTDHIPAAHGCHTEHVFSMLHSGVVPKDCDQYARELESGNIRRRLEREGSYAFSFSLADEKGDIRTKKMTVSAIDLRLGRVCLVRTDITDSVREQQGLLNMVAYTFELLGFLNISDGSFTMYTRQMVLENLPPYVIKDYDSAMSYFADENVWEEGREEVRKQFRMDHVLERLTEEPAGYDFVFSTRWEQGLRYKQVNVLWGDENYRTICMVRADVTDMLAAERHAKRALEDALAMAEEASRAKSDFLSSMSHDIRTPMNAIMGMTSLAKAHIDDRERLEDCLGKISVASRHLLSLINDVLDMSRIERSKILLNSANICLPQLMEQISAMVLPQAREAGLKFSIHLDGISHEHFYGDSLRISQILINLLSNAVKFTPVGGNVELKVEEKTSVNNRQRACYRFTVSDTGIGMPGSFLDQVFAPFARDSGAACIEGTGLGLSITKGLVDLMEGGIWVESRVGEGSVFRVELECEAAPESDDTRLPGGSGVPKPDQGNLFEGRRFLVAEDNEINAEILCELLMMHGAGTEVRINGVQAVEAFRISRPGTYDGILMDIQMPQMNGYEATRAIRSMAREDAGRIPIIAMTANAFAEDVQAAREAGMNAHVAKPVDMDVLQETLCRALGI